MNAHHQRLLRYFKWDHLPPALQGISQPFQTLALELLAKRGTLLDERGECDDAEFSVALRKLLEAKDAAVRAFIP